MTIAALASAGAASASWGIQQSPNPVPPTGGFRSVSCASATACTAVGDYQDSSGAFMTLTEVWDEARWSVKPSPSPGGTRYSFLQGVSCTSLTFCTAVGWSQAGKQTGLIETWNGSSWSIASPPQLAKGSDLHGVSCASATACTAVGTNFNSAGIDRTLVETEG